MKRFGVIALAAWSLAASVSFSKTETIPVDQIHPGMKGVTHTVLKGTTIELLETEILGVAKDALGPGQDMIIGKLVDPKTTLTGAVHGMSGSPLYIDGKLAGALSRRIALFEKDGHCGFTPIADMLDVAKRIDKKTPAVFISKSSPFQAQPECRVGASSMRLERLSIPLAVSGVDSARVGWIMEKMGFDAAGFQPVAGGKSSAVALPAAGDALQPGAPLSAVLMTGDIRMAGTGTLTWRDGNRVVGFGHPMLNMGNSEIPMAVAEIITVVPSYDHPYKMAIVGDIVGTITQDRNSAIGGWVGTIPKMPSYRIERTHNGTALRPFEGKFVSHPVLTPALIGTCLVAALTDTNETNRIFSAQIDGELKFENLPPLNFGGYYSGQDLEIMSAILQSLEPIIYLYGQTWEMPQTEKLTLNVRTEERQRVWGIESISTDIRRYDPGAEVRIQAQLRERYGDQAQQEFRIKLPANIKSGVVDIRVSGPAAIDQARDARNFSSLRSPRELIALLNARRAHNRLYLQVITRTPGQVIHNAEMPSLPSSVREIMDGGSRSEKPVALPEQVWVETSAEMSGCVNGLQSLQIEIK